jgi:predicted nuclease of predicted toxin-antitoxin system
VKFLIDAQLPPALAAWLQQAGHEAAHVRDVGLREAGDDTIWAYALQAGVVIVTKDEDFAARAALAIDSERPMSFGCALATRRTARSLLGWSPDWQRS